MAISSAHPKTALACTISLEEDSLIYDKLKLCFVSYRAEKLKDNCAKLSAEKQEVARKLEMLRRTSSTVRSWFFLFFLIFNETRVIAERCASTALISSRRGPLPQLQLSRRTPKS